MEINHKLRELREAGVIDGWAGNGIPIEEGLVARGFDDVKFTVSGETIVLDGEPTTLDELEDAINAAFERRAADDEVSQ